MNVMLLKTKKIYRTEKLAWTYKKANPEYKPGKIVLSRIEMGLGFGKCVSCKWNILVDDPECSMYQVVLRNRNGIKHIHNVRNLCLMKSAYTIERIEE